MKFHTDKSILFTTSGKQKFEVLDALQELLDSFSLELLEGPENVLGSSARWQAHIRLEKIG
jgi:hypothetical protein